jgi:hypothetical protein
MAALTPSAEDKQSTIQDQQRPKDENAHWLSCALKKRFPLHGSGHCPVPLLPG